mmetsp:Transcript_27556/g.55615  ORF Transcript_27556/g.55615 Transcript_27556/m.55615 type:complete len:358 (+) Transcript_27556:131-1204(+)
MRLEVENIEDQAVCATAPATNGGAAGWLDTLLFSVSHGDWLGTGGGGGAADEAEAAAATSNDDINARYCYCAYFNSVLLIFMVLCNCWAVRRRWKTYSELAKAKIKVANAEALAATTKQTSADAKQFAAEAKQALANADTTLGDVREAAAFATVAIETANARLAKAAAALEAANGILDTVEGVLSSTNLAEVTDVDWDGIIADARSTLAAATATDDPRAEDDTVAETIATGTTSAIVDTSSPRSAGDLSGFDNSTEDGLPTTFILAVPPGSSDQECDESLLDTSTSDVVNTGGPATLAINVSKGEDEDDAEEQDGEDITTELLQDQDDGLGVSTECSIIEAANDISNETANEAIEMA